MGLEVSLFTIKEVRDKNEYIVNMGRPDIARIKRDADVATAEGPGRSPSVDLQSDAQIRYTGSGRRQSPKPSERVLADTCLFGDTAESQRDLEVKNAQ